MEVVINAKAMMMITISSVTDKIYEESEVTRSSKML